MNPDTHLVGELLKKELRGTLSPREAAYLRTMQQLYEPGEWERMVADAVSECSWEGGEPEGWRQFSEGEGQRIVAQVQRRLDGIRWRRRFYPVAAGMVLAISLLGVLYRQYGTPGTDDSIRQITKCEEMPDRSTMPLRDFGVQLGSAVKDGERAELLIRPGQSGPVQRVGTLEVVRSATGEFEVRQVSGLHRMSWITWDQEAEGVEDVILRFSTGARQQAQIKLPGGMTVRLNAGSSLIYRAAGIGITGEAHIIVGPRIPGEPALPPLETPQLRLINTAPETEYMVTTGDGHTQVTLLDGRLWAHSKATGRSWFANHPRTRYQLGPATLPGSDQSQELWLSTRLQSYDRPLAWTEPIRTHKRIPLKQFVLEMSRWYGIEVQGIECLEDRMIQVKFCYRNPVDWFVLGLQKLGVEFQLVHGVYYFCKQHSGPPLAALSATGQPSQQTPDDELVAMCCMP